MEVLYEDNHLLAVNKPCGVPTQPDITGDKTMTDLAKGYIKKKYNKTGNIFIGLIHRLDRPVSGVLILAKTSKALERMNRIFKNREIQKTYWAIVKNRPAKDQDTLEHWLVKNGITNKTTAYARHRIDAQYAKLHYKVIKKSKNFFLLEVNPITGRPHQIRAQLAAIGCPIKGDLKYGYERSNKNTSGISLHARSLKFIHPIKKESLLIEAPVPKNDVWKYFE